MLKRYEHDLVYFAVLLWDRHTQGMFLGDRNSGNFRPSTASSASSETSRASNTKSTLSRLIRRKISKL